MFPGLKQHHIGCLVTSIDDFQKDNENNFPGADYSQVYSVSSQDVKVCFLQIAEDTLVELVEPGPDNQPLARLLAKGTTYYHIGFVTNTYAESVETLLNSHFKQLSEFQSEAFNGKRCSFFYHPYLRLIELIERDS